MLTAAFTGLLSGTMARVNAAPASGSPPSAVLQAADSSDKKDIEKHACKGNGGGSKKEWGKNSCKGPTGPSQGQRTKSLRGLPLSCAGPISQAYASESI